MTISTMIFVLTIITKLNYDTTQRAFHHRSRPDLVSRPLRMRQRPMPSSSSRHWLCRGERTTLLRILFRKIHRAYVQQVQQQDQGRKYTDYLIVNNNYDNLIYHQSLIDYLINIQDCLNAIGKHFHPECFNCTYCGKLFGNSPFFLEEGLPYCEAG